jgi:hypothetical protein
MSFGILVHRGCIHIKLFLRLLHRRKNVGHPLGLDFGSLLILICRDERLRGSQATR